MSEAWKQWEGQVIDSRFPLRQLLGESAHSAVFSTERLDRGGAKAAIKLVAASGAAAEAQLDRWRQVARLSHPNLLPLYHYGRCQLGNLDLLFAVMEFADETLAEILPQRALTAEEARQLLEVLVGALAFLHQRGLVHGDVQAANILAVGETIKLSSDTVRPIQAAAAGTGHKTANGDATPSATGSVEPAGDIYSLGITLVQALTQHSPFDAGTSLGHAAQPLPAPFDDIVLHALHPDPQLRWTAEDIATKLSPAVVAATAGAMSVPAAPAEKKSKASSSTVAPVAAKTAAKKRSESPAVSEPVRRVATADVRPASVPLSPVAPPRPKTASSGSLLRLAAVLGAAAVVTFFVVRGLHRETNGSNASATMAAKEKAAPATASPVASPPAVEKAAPKIAESRPAPTPVAEKPAPVTTALLPPAPKREPEVKPAVETKAVPSEPAPTEAATMKSEAKRTRAGDAEQDVLQQVLPEVSQKALSTIHGSVRTAVRVQVDNTGKVSEAQLDAPSGSTFFNDLALKAARKWQFQPAGTPTETSRSYLLHFEFTQAGPKASVIAR